jgi:hypothetical protein
MAKQRLVKKGSQYGILDEASNTVLPISENMKLVQKQGQYGVLDGDSVIPIDNFSETITDSDLDILKKKNSTESVGQPTPKPTSSVSPKIQGSGLVASPAKAGKEEVGMIDDIWNSFKGAGAKALASIASVPQFAQNAAIDIMSSVTGRSSDFNKLPSNVKKQVRDAIAGSLSAATPTGRFAQASQEATDYLNKKSEDIYKKTRQEEIDVVDELAKFGENPNAESIKKVLYQGLKTTFESAPYMAIGMASLPALAITSAAGKREEDISKEGDVGIGNLLNAGIYGAAEAVFEGTTNKILRKAANSAVGNPKAAKAVAEGFVKSVLKDFGQEATSEGATTAIQDLSDRITKGENIQDINYYKLAKNVANSAILGGISGGGISLTASTAGAARKYVASKIMPKNQIEKINNNTKTIQSLNLEHGEDVDPRVNEIVNKKIDELVAENEAIIAENEKIAENLSADQIKQVFDIDDKLEENYNSAKSIIDDAAMDDNAKKLLLDDLLKQQNNLKQEKDAIQKQATSEIPVQPETGISGEVAKGEPQAEPQVPTEEVKVEEVTTPSETIEVFHGGDLPSLEEGRPLYVSEDASQANEYAKMSGGEVSKFFLDKNKIASEQDAFDIMEELGLDSFGNFFELIDPRFDEAFSEEDIKRVFDTLKERGFEAVKYTDIDQKDLKSGIENILVLDASKSLKTEPTPTTEVKEEVIVRPEQKVEQATAVKKGIDAVNKAVERGRPLKKAVEGGIAFMQKTIAYEQADDVTREQMLRDINKKFGVKEKKAPSVKKVLGKKPDMILIDEMESIKKQLKIEAKAAKKASDIATKEGKQILKSTVKDIKQTRKDVISKLKSMITRGSLSKAQQKSLLNALEKTNIFNPVMRERMFERMQKMFERADYKDRIKEATTFRNRIKKLAKSETLQASVSNMAKDFSKVIPDLTDVDKYLEKARDVYNAIKNPLRVAVVIDDVNKFSETELKKQEEKLKNTLLDQYDYLVEDGLIDASMSLSEIQKYVMDVEKGLKPDTEANEAKIKNNLTELFDSMKESVDSILEDGYNPVTTEEVELDEYTRQLLSNYSSMDIDRMSISEAYRATEALENYLVNGIVDNMESMYRVYEGALKNAKLASQGVVAQNLKRFGILGRSNLYARSWAANISPLKSVIDLMFRSREMGAKFLKESGLRDIANSSSRAKTETQNIDKAYDEKFSKTKPNGQPFYSAENTYERGMYAHLRRTFEGTTDEINNEFNRRKKQIVDTIDKLMKSGDDKLINRAKVYQKVFDKFKDAKNIQEVEDSIDVTNASAVKWWNAIFDKYYPEVKKIASSVYNTVLEDDINYSPDNYEKILEDSVPDVNEVSTYRMAFNFLNSEKSGTLMKNNRLQELPKNRAMNFDFDFNNSSALGKMLVDVRTAPYVQQYRGFSNAPSFDEIFKDPKDRDVIKEKMNWYVNEVRSKNYSTANVRAKDAEKIFREISRIGTGRALGSALSIFKQFSTAMINTSINLANNPKALIQGLSTIKDKSAMKWLENSGYAIANRGLESQTAIESADRILNQTNPEAVNKLVGSTQKILNTIEKVNQFYLKSFLQNGDVFGARASWMAYYLNKLDSMGINTSNIDWSKHKLVTEAADYAQDKVDLQQNVSESAMLGKLLNSKNPYINMGKSLFIPFSSFVFNAKDKIATDLTILSSNANDKEKLDAIKSLSGTAVEMMIFEVMGSSITLGIELLANSLLGYDTDEDELREKLDKGLQKSTTRMFTDSFSPMPNWGDKIMVSLANKALNFLQKNIDEEDRKLFYAYEAKGDFNNIMGLIGGIPEIALKPLVNFGFTLDKILSDTYVDDFGNEVQFSDEDKEKLVGILAAQLAAPFLPTEYGRTLDKMEQKIEKEAK